MPEDPLPAAETVWLTERWALDSLRGVLELVVAGRLNCSAQTRRPSLASVQTVASALPGGDFYPHHAIAAFAWPLLLQAGGLANLNGARLQLTARGRVALLSPEPQVVRELWQRWILRGLIDEFSRVDQIKGQRSANVLTAVRGRRQIVATALSLLPPDEWMDVDDLFTWMRRRRLDPAIARGERAMFRLHIGHAEHGSLGYDGYGQWSILQGRYTIALIFEIAATLGLVDVRFVDPTDARTDYRKHFSEAELPYLSRYDGLRAIRVNALGVHALRDAPISTTGTE
ncbi:hypothetical protein ABIB25_002541 [Nakamurella sp. UYEF19]|uniref:hypothetical protein n=1 Tax=Nakamurella sp. UYEF19 TaxID=1756392 RepID=UPI00339714C7